MPPAAAPQWTEQYERLRRNRNRAAGRNRAPDLPGELEAGLVDIIASIAIKQLNGAIP